MTGTQNETFRWFMRALIICTILAALASAGGRIAAQDEKPWVAPDEATKVKNPYPPDPENLAAAEKLYKDNCVLCHGDKGKGDGIARRASAVPPTNFTDAKSMDAETDGSLFWKMTEGRGPMPSWKDSMSEKSAGNL